MLVTLATDLLVGVGAGLILKAARHIKNGVRPGTLFKAIVEEERNRQELALRRKARPAVTA